MAVESLSGYREGTLGATIRPIISWLFVGFKEWENGGPENGGIGGFYTHPDVARLLEQSYSEAGARKLMELELDWWHNQPDSLGRSFALMFDIDVRVRIISLFHSAH